MRIRLSDARGFVLGEVVRDMVDTSSRGATARRFELRTSPPFDQPMGPPLVVEVTLEDLDALYAAQRALEELLRS